MATTLLEDTVAAGCDRQGRRQWRAQDWAERKVQCRCGARTVCTDGPAANSYSKPSVGVGRQVEAVAAAAAVKLTDVCTRAHMLHACFVTVAHKHRHRHTHPRRHPGIKASTHTDAHVLVHVELKCPQAHVCEHNPEQGAGARAQVHTPPTRQSLTR